MVFPDSARVIYERNTLTKVICQVRYPAILRIDSELPADFQDQVRDDYPLLTEKQSTSFPDELPGNIAKIVINEFPSTVRAYDFVSEDESWTLGLTKGFLALSTTNYERWEDFKSHLETPLNSLVEIYKPAFYSRTGLRYQNTIDRQALGLSDVPWTRLLKDWILGELAMPELNSRVKHVAREVVIDLDDDSSVRIKHGLSTQKETDQQLYVIDADYFTEKRLEVSDAISTLDRFNRESGRLFRWCITERLHEAMGPNEIGEYNT